MNLRRLGLFGGTFDPPHLGHVAALRAAASSGRFDRIVVTVAGDPYAKDDVLSAELRLAMAHAAFDELDLVEVSDLEIKREGPSYTIDTVRDLREENRDIDLIVGADLAAQLDSWHEASALRGLVVVAVVPRPQYDIKVASGWRSYEIPMEPVDLSSTFVRELALDTCDLEKYIPRDVIPIFEGARG